MSPYRDSFQTERLSGNIVTVAANGPAASDFQAGPGPLSDGIRPLVTPQCYADRVESPLRATLQSGTQELPLVLETE
jgi:hypothetical protein